jgi:acyl-CoA synthetase (AMP-forming)/AMP-acid ligase II
MTILETALRRADQDPEGIALWFYGKGHVTTVSHRDLIQGARRYQAALASRGVKRGDIVILLLDHSLDQYFGFVGAMLLGAIPSFMPPLTSKQIPALYWSSHAALFQRIQPRALIIGDSRAEQLRTHIPDSAFAVVTPSIAAGETEITWPPVDASDDDIALLQHSSGTTQLKKGVQLTHRAILSQVTSYSGVLGISSQDRIASWLPLYHDMGLIACFVMPLVLGLPVASLDPFEWVVAPDLLLRAIETHRCTLTWMPNFAFHHLVRTRRPEARHDVSSIRAWIDCSEPCRAATFDLFAATFADCGVMPDRLQVCYAMAETVFAVSQTRIGRAVSRLRVNSDSLRTQGAVAVQSASEPATDLLSAGAVLPGLTTYIVDDGGQELPPGHIGEIAVAGDFLFSGYDRLPEQTTRKLRNGTYYTNDRGFKFNDELYVLGRVDDLIIINGRNFYCHEIEHVVSGVPGVKPGRAVAFPIDDPGAGTQAGVVVAELDAPGRPDTMLARQIKQTVLSECDLILRDVVLVPPNWIVKTTSGKISRTQNQRKYLSQGHAGGRQ